MPQLRMCRRTVWQPEPTRPQRRDAPIVLVCDACSSTRSRRGSHQHEHEERRKKARAPAVRVRSPNPLGLLSLSRARPLPRFRWTGFDQPHAFGAVAADPSNQSILYKLSRLGNVLRAIDCPFLVRASVVVGLLFRLLERWSLGGVGKDRHPLTITLCATIV